MPALTSTIFSKYVTSIIYARLAYAINWFNIISIFPLISVEFYQDIHFLGILSAAFLAGIGIFQIPAGILSARLGARKIAIYGMIISSSASFACALTTDIFQISILRFLVGIGMAFFFSSGVTLIARNLGSSNEGLAIGLLNAAQAIGGIIGLFGWIIIAELIGWRSSLALSGMIGISSSLMLYLFIPGERIAIKLNIREISSILFNEKLVLFGIVLLGIQIGWSSILTFTALFAQEKLSFDAATGALIASQTLTAALVGAPVLGRLNDKIKKSKLLLLVACGAIAAGLLSLSLENTISMLLSITVVGFFSAGAFTIVYSEARKIRSKAGLDIYETLAVSWVNGISLFGIIWVPIIFTQSVSISGYSLAWTITGLLSFGLILVPTAIIKWK